MILTTFFLDGALPAATEDTTPARRLLRAMRGSAVKPALEGELASWSTCWRKSQI